MQSEATHTGLVGGFRSGKSQAGVFKTLNKKIAMPGVDVAYYLPTYSLIKDIAFPKFSELLTNHKIDFELNRSDKDIHTPFGRIICRSMDNPDLIIGYEVGYSLIDEADVLPKKKMQEVMIKVLARNSVKYPGNNNATDFVSTPEGFNFLYDFFVKNASPNKKLIRASTKNNPYISENYIKSLQEQYSAEQLQAYLEGEFVNLESGTCYYKYNRFDNHSDRTATEHDTLHVGLDFNIGNMHGVIHVIDDKPIAVDEIVKAYDTDDVCRLLRDRYPNNRIIVYPDASGSQRRTSAPTTDIQILKDNGFKVRTGSTNPPVKDRISNMNRIFLDGNNQINYYVNHHKCPEYCEALERQAYGNNGEPDKSSGFDHITEAAAYFIWREYPPKRRHSSPIIYG